LSEEVNFRVSGLDEVDEFFADAGRPLNTLVRANNAIAGALESVFEATAKVAGAFTLAAGTTKDVDFVRVTLGPKVPAALAAGLAVKALAEDRALSAALEALQAALAGLEEPAKVNINAKGRVHSSEIEVEEAVAAVNGAFEAFAAAVAPLKATLSVVHAAVPGATRVKLALNKAQFKDLDDAAPTVLPATVLELYALPNADALMTAMDGAHAAIAGVTKAAEGAAGFELTFNGKKLVMPFRKRTAKGAPKAPYPELEQVEALKVAIAAYNSALFKATLQASKINAKISLVTSFTEILKAMKAKVAAEAAAKGVAGVEDIFKLEFEVVEVGEGDDKVVTLQPKLVTPGLEMPAFPACLPGKARIVYDGIVAIVEAIKAAKASIPELKDQIEGLIDSAVAMAERGKELAEEAVAGDGAKLARIIGALMMNVKELGDAREIPGTIFGTLKRVFDELRRAAEALKTTDMKKLAAAI